MQHVEGLWITCGLAVDILCSRVWVRVCELARATGGISAQNLAEFRRIGAIFHLILNQNGPKIHKNHLIFLILNVAPYCDSTLRRTITRVGG